MEFLKDLAHYVAYLTEAAAVIVILIGSLQAAVIYDLPPVNVPPS